MKTEAPTPTEAPKTSMAAAFEAAGLAGQEAGAPAPVLQKTVVVEAPPLPQPTTGKEVIAAMVESSDIPPGLVNAVTAGLRRMESAAPTLPPVPAIPTKPKGKVRMLGAVLLGSWKNLILAIAIATAFIGGAFFAVWAFLAIIGGEQHTTNVQLHQGLSDAGMWSNWRFKSDSEKMTHITTSGRGDIQDISATSRGEDYKLTPKGWVKK